ncbi:MAG: MBL fold metallo-hydrolase [Patescibacteria group bacterium]|jgi:L-ascorbate metabolism protein UlaG (beta-lactamase superfamily)
MILSYFGHSCFKIQDKVGTDGVTVITDPFNKNLGLKVPNCEADVVTVSHNHDDHNNFGSLRGEAFIVDTPGEYDVKGIMIVGVETFHDDKNGEERGRNIAYRLEVDDIVLAHLGDLGHVLTNEQLEQLGNIDVLLVPIGGHFTLDAKKAVEVINQIEPRIVIPMHYKLPKSQIDLDGLDKFIKELGVEPQCEEKFKISKKDLPQEGMSLVVLEVME